MKDEVVLLTGPGAAAIAVVRIAGAGVTRFLQEHFSREVKPLHAVHGELRDGEMLIDDPVIVLAEDRSWADINLHGGPWVVEATVRLAESEGFMRAPALPRLVEIAVDAATVIEKEVLAALPLATTELAVRALLAQRDAWRVLVDDPSLFSREQLKEILEDHVLEHLLQAPSVAIVGVPNAGKSTLANQLYGQERSITADLPGTTRDWVGELADIDGLAVRLFDTPGLRETEDVIERQAIAQSRSVIEDSQLVLVLLDVTQPMKPQRALLGSFPDAVVIANKSDCNPEWDELPAIKLVANQGKGVDAVRVAILERFECREIDVALPRCWTRRQREYVAYLMRSRHD